MEFLTEGLFLGKPIWMWVGFLTIVVALLVFDLGVLHKENKEIEVAESLKLSAFYFALAMLFGGWVWWYMGAQSGLEYYTGFFVEWSLSLDNVFAISMIFTYFAVPRTLRLRGPASAADKSKARAQPKSEMRRVPLAKTRRFSGYRSRCASPK